jgi:preprotein translocase subunit SecE
MAKTNKDTGAGKKEVYASKTPARGGVKADNLPERSSLFAKVAPIPAKKAARIMAKKAKSAEPKTGIYQKVRQFLREVKVELKKVTWPTRKETLASTAVVLVLVLILSFFLGVVDMGLTKVITLVIR